MYCMNVWQIMVIQILDIKVYGQYDHIAHTFPDNHKVFCIFMINITLR